jgi:hypothetical protein
MEKYLIVTFNELNNIASKYIDIVYLTHWQESALTCDGENCLIDYFLIKVDKNDYNKLIGENND